MGLRQAFGSSNLLRLHTHYVHDHSCTLIILYYITAALITLYPFSILYIQVQTTPTLTDGSPSHQPSTTIFLGEIPVEIIDSHCSGLASTRFRTSNINGTAPSWDKRLRGWNKFEVVLGREDGGRGLGAAVVHKYLESVRFIGLDDIPSSARHIDVCQVRNGGVGGIDYGL